MDTTTERQTQAQDIEPPAPDKYDAAVAYLTKHPGEIGNAWGSPSRHVAGCLFYFVQPHDARPEDVRAQRCGCLTMIRSEFDTLDAWTPELTKAIREDERIPGDSDRITVDHLPIFAGWQRRIDRALNRK